MKKKNRILAVIAAVFLLFTLASWAMGYNTRLIIFLGFLVLFMFYVLWDMPPKHKNFSYKDQQRAMTDFDRSDYIDMGRPDWAKDEKKRRR